MVKTGSSRIKVEIGTKSRQGLKHEVLMAG